MPEYSLSIIIPTKNRQTYCIVAIKEILNLKNSDIQIIIQDNSDSDILREELELLNNKNLKYHYHPGTLSFVDNFSEAVSLATGKYICIIGDDDSILPNIISVTEYANANGYDAIIPGLNAVYCWPMEKPFIKGAENGYLCLSFIKNKLFEVNLVKGIIQLLEHGGQGYQKFDLVRLYHGIVKKDCIEKVIQLTGKCFDGLTPDIYISVALSLVCKKVLRLGYPITISGICPRSGSSDSATGRHTGKLEDAPHFKGHKDYQWDRKAPAIYSVESIWGETVCHALRNFKQDDYYQKFRVDILDAICFSKYPQFRCEILAHAKQFGYSMTKIKILSFKYKCFEFLKRVFKKIFRKRNDVKKYYNIQSISEAAEICTSQIKNMIE